MGLGIASVTWWLNKNYLGIGSQGLYQIGGCYRNDEFGVTYQVSGTLKGKTVGQVVISKKYPIQESHRVGSEQHWPSDENSQKLYPIPCPQD